MDKNQESNARRVFEIRSRMGGREGVRHFRTDGYINLLNKYGGKRDSSSAYNFMPEPTVPDIMLTSYYEGNGLFAKIIDTPADEALKRGFDLKLKDDAIQTFIEDKMDELEWEEKAATAIKWARLYGGSIIVMLINDGRGLDEPVNWSDVRGIDELRVYERPLVMPWTWEAGVLLCQQYLRLLCRPREPMPPLQERHPAGEHQQLGLPLLGYAGAGTHQERPSGDDYRSRERLPAPGA